jgi:carboxypeptidase Taq
MAVTNKANPFRNKIILQILDHYKTLWAISYASGVVHWDLETYMPPAGAVARGEALAKLSTLRQKLFLDNRFVALIHRANEEKKLTDEEKAVVRILLRSLKFYEQLPPSFLEEFEKLTNNATVIWREAKAKNKYDQFEPHLKKIFEMNRRAADYLGYKDSPYDALLDQYEEELKVKDVEEYFGKIREPLKELVGNIVNSKKFYKKHPLESAKYDKDKLIALNDKILKLFFDEYGQRLRLDVSSHPFTTSFSREDTRITTWYHEADFGRSLLATIHEFGHALYDLQSARDLELTPVAGGSSLVIHESQSRFWENFVGRSESFVKFIMPDLKKAVNADFSAKDVYEYFNKVKPSLHRVEADEVTYHFHIMLRFEIEKGLMEGSLKFNDVREVWKSKMKEYLGVEPKTDTDGVLQDIHWSGGSVGYFPTYSLGTSLGAQWERSIKVKDPVEDVKKIKLWLQKNIHSYGSVYTLEGLLQKNKMKYDPTVNLNYLQNKYSKIYGF